ncbi:MAG: N-acetylglucosamine kinase [Xenococcaceae cyanobacterium]
MSYYLLGIDGGGTKTVCLLASEFGTVISRGVGGASNPYLVPSENIRTALSNAVWQAINSSGLSQFQLKSVCAGIAGAKAEEKQIELKNLIWQILNELPTNSLIGSQFNSDPNILVVPDLVISLVAGAGVRHGVVVISGTGSVVYGETLDGRKAQAVGWGNILGNEGSGYWIGSMALKAVVRANDRRGSSTRLQQLILDQWNLSSPIELIHYVLSECPTSSDISSLALLVNLAAQEGDSVALRILETASRELFSGVLAVVKQLGLSASEFPLVLSGGVLINIEQVRNQLVQKIQRHIPIVNSINLCDEPAYGALIIAQENASGNR